MNIVLIPVTEYPGYPNLDLRIGDSPSEDFDELRQNQKWAVDRINDALSRKAEAVIVKLVDPFSEYIVTHKTFEKGVWVEKICVFNAKQIDHHLKAQFRGYLPGDGEKPLFERYYVFQMGMMG